MAPFTRGRALVIGVGAYGDDRWDVPVAARDARGVYETLVDPARAAYDRGKVELLTDGEATRAGVLAALTRLADRCQADSVALISVTSHGARGEDGLYYIATSDARFTTAGLVAAGTGLHVAQLARALRDIPAGRLLLVVNACFAGDLGGELARAGIPAEPAGEMLPDVAGAELANAGEGRAIIAAGRASQRSYFRPGERHSYFGQALIDALQGSAASAASGYVGLYELYEGVHRQVLGATSRRLGAPQEPVLTVLQAAGPFPVASYPGATGGDGRISQRPLSDAAVRVVERDVITASGQGSTAIKAEQGSSVKIDNRLISADGATIMGDFKVNNAVSGDLIITNYGPSRDDTSDDTLPDPMRQLPILRERVAVARNVDEDARDDAAEKLKQAHRALGQSDSAKARQRIDEALAILRAMDNGYIRSAVRKIEAVRDAI